MASARAKERPLLPLGELAEPFVLIYLVTLDEVLVESLVPPRVPVGDEFA